MEEEEEDIFSSVVSLIDKRESSKKENKLSLFLRENFVEDR